MRTRITISIQPEDEQKVRKTAVIQKMSVSEYIRSVLRKDWER